MIGRHASPASGGKSKKSQLAFLAMSVATVTALAMSPQPAHAFFEGNGLYVRGIGAESPGGFWLGAYTAPHNVETRYPVWCTHMWRANPQPSDTASISDLGESRRWGPDETDLSTAQMAWLLERYQGDRHPENRATLSFLIHANFEGDQAGKNTQDSVNRLVDRVREQLPQVYEKAQDYVRQAQKAAVATYENGVVETHSPRSGVLKDLGVKNEKGEWISGLKIRIRLIGPARFSSTGTREWEGTTSNSGLTVDWEASGNGTVAWEGEYLNPVRTSLTRYGVKSSIQDTASYGNRPEGDKEEKRFKGGTWKVLMDFQPMLRSQVKETTITGSTITDTITAFADPNYGDGKWLHDDHGPIPVTFEGTAYDLGEDLPASPIEANSIGQDAPVIGHASMTFRGEGTQSVSLPLPESSPGPRFISWVWKVRKDQQGEYSSLVHSDWSDRLGLTSETSIVPWKIQVHSAAQLKETSGGNYLIDDLWVSGFPRNHPYWKGRDSFGGDSAHMRQRLLFFPQGLDINEENRDRAEEIGRVELPARNGYYPSLGDLTFKVVPHRPGTYVFTTEFDGDGRVEAFRSPVDDPKEQFTIKDQTLIRLETHAMDAADEDHVLASRGPVKIIDKVCYEGLETGGEYTLKASAVDRETGESVVSGGTPVLGRLDFQANNSNGCTEVVLHARGEDLQGKRFVIFEDLYRGDERVAFHRDINSVEQSMQGVQPQKPGLARTGSETQYLVLFSGMCICLGEALRRKSKR